MNPLQKLKTLVVVVLLCKLIDNELINKLNIKTKYKNEI